eukprot:TRINITY_DN14325_c1_g1_i1.p1 TRINITY_DN14325_c1_g1~~TRINITY_DN14325_c1_g1_i1.p1  ORF type:complete len:447 (-),score=74.29 TRINITY_DN14325_c1_g1_i1:86-1426(-)
MQHPFDLHGFEAWPQGHHLDSSPENIALGSKALLRRKLQPLQRLPPCPYPVDASLVSAGARVAREGGLSVGEALAADLPAGYPSASHRFAPPERPQTAERPRTAQRTAPPLAQVAFPARLGLRRPCESAGPVGLWAGRGDDFVLPLDTQRSVRELAIACGEGKREVLQDSRLTIWAVNAEELEPLAARRVDRALAVEPVTLVAESCTAPRAPGAQRARLRYGECFRLRDADTDLYLGHSSEPGGRLRWERLGAGQSPSECRGLRFAAHGSELGAPLLYGRPLSLRRVASPAPPSDTESEDDSEDECSDEEFMAHRRSLKREAAAKTAASSSCTPVEQAKPPDVGPLLCRVADTDSMFSVALLPVGAREREVIQQTPEVLTLESPVCSDEEELANIDTILLGLRSQLAEARARGGADIEELQSRIAQGERLRLATQDALCFRRSSRP